MAIVHIRVNGYEYDIACDNGEEEHLRYLADELDGRVRALTSNRGAKPGEGMSLLMAALVMADELIENKKELQHIAAETSQMAAQATQNSESPPADDRMKEIEAAMAVTLEEIAIKIERIADRIEMR